MGLPLTFRHWNSKCHFRSVSRGAKVLGKRLITPSARRRTCGINLIPKKFPTLGPCLESVFYSALGYLLVRNFDRPISVQCLFLYLRRCSTDMCMHVRRTSIRARRTETDSPVKGSKGWGIARSLSPTSSSSSLYLSLPLSALHLWFP